MKYFASLLCFFVVSANAANHYIRAGAGGANSGSSWTDAWTDFGFTWNAGDTYYIAAGTYNTQPTLASGNITILKATVAAHGTETGWTNSFATGQAVLTSGFRMYPAAGGLVLDGVTGGGPGSWTNNYGIKITYASAGSSPVFGCLQNGLNGLTLRHLEIVGNRLNSQSGDGNDCINIWPASNITVSYCWLYDAGVCLIHTRGPNLTFEYIYGGPFGSGWATQIIGPAAHDEIMALGLDADYSSNVIVRNSIFTHADYTGGIVGYMHGVEIYGNVFDFDPTTVNDYSRVFGSKDTPYDPTNMRIYHNTFVNISKDSANASLFYLTAGTGNGNVMYNNLFYGIMTFGSYDNLDALDYDYYATINDLGFGTPTETHGATTNSPTKAQLFISPAAQDYTPKVNTPAGLALDSSYTNVDMFGNVRNSHTRGAIEFASATTNQPTITSQPVAVTNWSGANIGISVGAGGGGALTYQWQMNSNAIPGATSSTYQSNSVQTSFSAYYRCMVTNEVGWVASDNAYVSITNAAPYLTTQPTNVSAYIGDSVAFYMAAAGSTPQTNHWRKGGSVIAGATNTSYVIASAQASDADTYDCVVSNLYGNATSSASILTLSSNTTPGIARSYIGGTITSFGTYTQTGVNCTGANRLLLVPLITHADNGNHVTSVTFAGVALTRYAEVHYWDNNGYLDFWALTNPPSATSNVVVSATTVNENEVAVIVVTNAPQYLPFETFSSNYVVGPTAVGSYSLTPTSVGGELVVDALGIATSTHNWTNDSGQTLLASGNNGNLTFLGVSSKRAAAGGTQMTWGGTSGNGDSPCMIAVAIKNNTGTGPPPATPPSITANPTGFTNLIGTTNSLTVTASGDPTLVYQWRMNSNAVSGATSATFTKTYWDLTNSGNWQCFVTNSSGTVTSAVAVVSVTNGVAPAFTTNPTGLTNLAGVQFYLLSAATGNSPITYQWRNNSNNIAGATLSNYTNSSPLAGDSGSYDVVAANAYGSKTSSIAPVSITNAPVTARPVNVSNLRIGTLRQP